MSIESEPNIDRFARLNLHDLDEDQDADDDMTPSSNEKQGERAFNYQKLEESSAGEEEDEEDTLRADDANTEDVEQEGQEIVEEVAFTSTTRQELLSAQDDARSDCASDVSTLSPDIEETLIDDPTEQVAKEPEIVVKVEMSDLKEESTQSNNLNEEAASAPPKAQIELDEYTIESPTRGQSIDLEEFEVVESIEPEEQQVVEVPEIQVIRQPSPVPIIQITHVVDVNSFLDSERSSQPIIEEVPAPAEDKSSQSFIDQEIISQRNPSSPPSPPIITTEESSPISAVVDEDISNYDNFITIMQSNVLKEAAKGFRFPIKPENKPGDFPKTVSELITFDDEDMTAVESKNLQMRKRQDSIKVKIQTENTTERKKTGHHRRYNMPAHSIDMGTRIILSNRKLEEDKKVFPRKRQIFIPGNFPRDILHHSEYKLKDGLAEGTSQSEPVRVRRITYKQPIVQLTMIREEQKPVPTVVIPPPPPPQSSSSAPASVHVLTTSQSVPTTPQGLTPRPNIEPVRRSRSVTPFIVDRDDPMMQLLKDSMEIPLVYDSNL